MYKWWRVRVTSVDSRKRTLRTLVKRRVSMYMRVKGACVHVERVCMARHLLGVRLRIAQLLQLRFQLFHLASPLFRI